MKYSIEQTITFYTLLYLRTEDKSEKLSENKNSNLLDYIHCCEALSTSLKVYGFDLFVLTNKKEKIEEHSKNIKVKNIEFKLNVPDDIRFYSAHYKFDVFNYLSKQEGYNILIDCDIVCINNMPANMEYLFSSGTPTCYDITDQEYPAYGRESIIAAKSLLMDTKSVGNWFGGEFIGGNSDFFKELYSKCMKYWERYRQNYHNLQHQGDETLTSCAIEEYQKQNKQVFDIGTVGGVGRYWSLNTKHVQKGFKSYKDNFLIHLPADKNFIAKHPNFNKTKFISDYDKYLNKRKIRNVLVYIKRKLKNIQ